jgi:hypothetical protein
MNNEYIIRVNELDVVQLGQMVDGVFVLYKGRMIAGDPLSAFLAIYGRFAILANATGATVRIDESALEIYQQALESL